MSQTTNPPLCIWCAVEMVQRTIFGKEIFECPRCKRRIPASSVVPEVENPEPSQLADS